MIFAELSVLSSTCNYDSTTLRCKFRVSLIGLIPFPNQTENNVLNCERIDSKIQRNKQTLNGKFSGRSEREWFETTFCSTTVRFGIRSFENYSICAPPTQHANLLYFELARMFSMSSSGARRLLERRKDAVKIVEQQLKKQECAFEHFDFETINKTARLRYEHCQQFFAL